MARYVVEVRIQDRTARARLAPRRDPYWRAIGEGRHLGYVKGLHRGVWMARVRVGDRYIKERMGAVDDVHDANGDSILSWDQAVVVAIAWCERQLGGGPSEDEETDLAVTKVAA